MISKHIEIISYESFEDHLALIGVAASTSAAIAVWGTGNVRREFLYVDDCAAGIIFLLKNYSDNQHVNLGAGSDITVRELAEQIKLTAGFAGALKFDPAKPDGTPRKLLDTTLINDLGWQPKVELSKGLCDTFKWYLDHIT